MDNSSPLEILMAEYLPQAVAHIETEVEKIELLPAVKPLGALKSPEYGNDPTELIAHRFLYRGGVCLLLGPTGIGKSSCGMQLGMHMAVGRGLFGIEPGACYRQTGMRVLLVQAENDEGDLAEMRDGVLKGCTDLSDDEKRLAQERMLVVTVCDRSAERFAEMLGALLESEGPIDLVLVDPAFAYLGGDTNSQRDVSHFMRELLNPLLQKYRCGMVLCHHTNKPLRGKEKDGWSAGDFAYLGAGSAEWINPARAALAIRSIGSDRVFELRAAKRGRRLGWKDDEGQSTNVQYIAHHDEPGVICWRAATPEEVADVLASDKPGRPVKCDLVEVVHCVAAHPGENQGYYNARLAAAVGCSESAAQNAIQRGVIEGLISEARRGQQKQYSTTPKGDNLAQNRPSAVDWRNH